MCDKGLSLRQIAEKCVVSHTMVARIRKKNVSAAISSQNGRPQLISDRAAREVAHCIRSDSYETPKIATQEIEISASEWTIRRSLRRIGLRAKEEENESALSNKNIKLRKQFVDTYEEWTTKDWKRVIWSDETKINRFKFDARSWYWTSSENNDQPGGIKQTMKFGSGSIMCWNCFTHRGVGPLVRIEGIIREKHYLTILKNNLPSVVNSIGYNEREIVFQQDGDPKHTAKIIKTWLENQNFSVMKWPAQSPDMNPIENLWSILKRRLEKYNNLPSNVHELWERTQQEWYNIEPQIIKNLIDSMPRRLKALKRSKGKWTKY